MIKGEVPFETRLPGYDALLPSRRVDALPLDVDEADLANFQGRRPYMGHLQNSSYRNYVKIPKRFVDENGARYLSRLGGELEREQLPEFLDAAGWAFAEAALVDDHSSTSARIQRLNRAEDIWERALEASDGLHKTELGELLRFDSQPFRIALNLAYTPLMKSIVVGNATEKVRRKVLLDTLAISELAAVHCNLAWRDGIRAGVRQLSGFILEGVALSALLLLDDSRYLPIPSSTRADSGYYYPQQTHDIVVINQHGGTIKKAIPSEVKAEPSVSDRRRYQAVIISKYDLGASEHSSIKNTMQAFSNVVRGRDMEGDRETVAQIRDRLMNKLEDYQRQQVTQESGRTKFYGKPQYRRGAGRAALCKAS